MAAIAFAICGQVASAQTFPIDPNPDRVADAAQAESLRNADDPAAIDSGQLGQRVATRQAIAPRQPLDRVSTRVANRIENRVRNRIGKTDSQGLDAAQSFRSAEDRTRALSSSRPR